MNTLGKLAAVVLVVVAAAGASVALKPEPIVVGADNFDRSPGKLPYTQAALDACWAEHKRALLTQPVDVQRFVASTCYMMEDKIKAGK